MDIDRYMTPTEAAYRWGIPQETVKNKLKPSKNNQLQSLIDTGLIKYFCKPGGKRNEWIVTDTVMDLWFGKNIK